MGIEDRCELALHGRFLAFSGSRRSRKIPYWKRHKSNGLCAGMDLLSISLVTEHCCWVLTALSFLTACISSSLPQNSTGSMTLHFLWRTHSFLNSPSSYLCPISISDVLGLLVSRLPSSSSLSRQGLVLWHK